MKIDYVKIKGVSLRYKGKSSYTVIPDEITEPVKMAHDMDTEIMIKNYIEKK